MTIHKSKPALLLSLGLFLATLAQAQLFVDRYEGVGTSTSYLRNGTEERTDTQTVPVFENEFGAGFRAQSTVWGWDALILGEVSCTASSRDSVAERQVLQGGGDSRSYVHYDAAGQLQMRQSNSGEEAVYLVLSGPTWMRFEATTQIGSNWELRWPINPQNNNAQSAVSLQRRTGPIDWDLEEGVRVDLPGGVLEDSIVRVLRLQPAEYRVTGPASSLVHRDFSQSECGKECSARLALDSGYSYTLRREQ